MVDEKSPDVWYLIFDQTPTFLRWTLGFLTMGIFTMVGCIYRDHKRNVERIERDLNAGLRETNKTVEHTNDRIDDLGREVSRNFNDFNKLLFEIAQNTRRPDSDKVHEKDSGQGGTRN